MNAVIRNSLDVRHINFHLELFHLHLLVFLGEQHSPEFIKDVRTSRQSDSIKVKVEQAGQIRMIVLWRIAADRLEVFPHTLSGLLHYIRPG